MIAQERIEDTKEIVGEGVDELEKLLNEKHLTFNEGSIVKGRIIRIDPKEVLVDIGFKSEGNIPASDFRDVTRYQEGDEIDVYIDSLEDQNGMIVLSKSKADKILNWEMTVKACEENKRIKGTIYKKVKGGLMVDVGMDAFLPASQIDIKHPRDLDSYIGKTLEFKIIKISYQRKNVVVSRRQIIEEERKLERERLLKTLKPGDVVRGIVKNITDFGAFIDLHGIDGLLHITDMSWKRISHPSEMLAIGDEVDVVVLDFDKEKERVSLGLKQKTKNPWEDINKKYPVGVRIKGRIVNIMPYGAFVELEEGIEGLIHISELSWTRRINHPSEMLAIGDNVECMVLNLDKDQQKISLGLKQLEPNPWEKASEKYKVGDKISGRIRNITSYGAFIELEEGIDGLIHISDMSWTKKINHPSEIIKKGDVVEAVILEVDIDNKRIALGLKQLEPNPWQEVEKKYNIGQSVKGKVTKITNFGAFIDLGDKIEGLIHISQVGTGHVEKIEDVMQVGDEVEAKIINVDAGEKKIGLSIKELLMDSYKSKDSKERESFGRIEHQELSDLTSPDEGKTEGESQEQ
ncbi:MAG: 30S ribosomal protein S1 [Candidatus Aureabacteria bacterium]|nr:30S ribosomal protein S1 [Candidatus Auribacterota bacterium]